MSLVDASFSPLFALDRRKISFDSTGSTLERNASRRRRSRKFPSAKRRAASFFSILFLSNDASAASREIAFGFNRFTSSSRKITKKKRGVQPFFLPARLFLTILTILLFFLNFPNSFADTKNVGGASGSPRTFRVSFLFCLVVFFRRGLRFFASVLFGLFSLSLLFLYLIV